jgi:hypothetical protein
MEPLKDKFSDFKQGTKNKLSNTLRSISLKYKGTKVSKNIDTLVTFQSIYYQLINA